MGSGLGKRLLLAAVLVGTAACGTEESTTDKKSSGGSFCANPNFSACGGDVVGSWTDTDFCSPVDPSQFDDEEHPACDGAVSWDMEFETHLEFQSNGTYQFSIRFAGSTRMNMNEACADSLSNGAIASGQVNMGQYCDLMDTSFATNEEMENGSCSLQGGNCMCTGSLPEETDLEIGTYEVSGNSLITTSDGPGAEAESINFCVIEDVMTVQDFDNDSGEEINIRFQRE